MAVDDGTLAIYQPAPFSRFPHVSNISIYDGEVKEAVEKAYNMFRSSPTFSFNQAISAGFRFVVNLPSHTIIYSESTVTIIDNTHSL